MVTFAVVPATPDHLPAIARLQFEACGSDPGFHTIFPRGPTPASLQHAVSGMEDDMDHDPRVHLMLVKDALTGEIASYAQWHFFLPPQTQDDIDQELLMDKFRWPDDANADAGNNLVRNSTRKRHQVVGKWFGLGTPYAYLSIIGTARKYQKQGAASLLVKWGTDRADDYALPAYLEATKSGYSVYQKHGFEEVDQLTVEISQWNTDGGQDFINYCMIRPAAVTNK